MFKLIKDFKNKIAQSLATSRFKLEAVDKIEEPKRKYRVGMFSTDIIQTPKREELVDLVYERSFQKTVNDFPVTVPEGQSRPTFDAAPLTNNKILLNQGFQSLPDTLLGWYGSQGFIGYQQCALIAQNWLVDKACTMPARDAVRKGYDVTINNGMEVSEDIIDAIREYDKKFRVNENLVEFVRKGRIFGIRIAMFKLRGKMQDREYYEKPFNIDSIQPGEYLGITQIDPYWVTPELSGEAASDPSAVDFYEPTWWRVNGIRIHKSHLVIMKTNDPADILKPTYFYGGIPKTQQIYERVYAAERIANEAPQLALSKRTTLINVDLAQALAKQASFQERMQAWSFFWNNYGIKVLGEKETAQQFDTSLADLDAIIMTQYQIVAAVAGVPATKLLGTSPKGFNATGEFEESSYHEELESVQTHDMSPLIDRHHAILIRSHIAPEFGIEPFETTVKWKPLDAPTAKERIENSKLRADTGLVLIQSGAISPAEERKRLVSDPDSGYDGLEEADLDNEFLENPNILAGQPDEE